MNSCVVSFAVPGLLKHDSISIKKTHFWYLFLAAQNDRKCFCDSPQSYRIKTPPSAADTSWMMGKKDLDSKSDSSDQSDVLVSGSFWRIIWLLFFIFQIESIHCCFQSTTELCRCTQFQHRTKGKMKSVMLLLIPWLCIPLLCIIFWFFSRSIVLPGRNHPRN